MGQAWRVLHQAAEDVMPAATAAAAASAPKGGSGWGGRKCMSQLQGFNPPPSKC